jgi:hypothetical protein
MEYGIAIGTGDAQSGGLGLGRARAGTGQRSPHSVAIA